MHQLPLPGKLNTATDVIDHLTEEVGNLIITENDNIYMTQEQFMATFGRAFPIALAEFLGRLGDSDPDLAVQLRRQFVTEEEERQAD